MRLGGTRGLELRVEDFNVLDIDQFGNPARVVSQPLIFGVLSPLNSGPTGTATARQFQLGLRFDFYAICQSARAAARPRLRQWRPSQRGS